MSGSVKVGGAYRAAAPYAKVAGTWKFAPEAWTKVSGTWKKWFLAGGIIDSEFNAIDTGYSAGNNTVNTMMFQPDGKIVLGGTFGTWNSTNVYRIVRIDSAGQVDAPFTANTGTAANSTVSALGLQSDGKIVVGGGFTTWNGVTINRILRLNADGTRDTTFSTTIGSGANNSVFSLKIQPDGKIVIVGAFITWNGVTANRIIRLNADGTVDTDFMTNAGTAANNSINAVSLQSDGKILIVGNFTAWGATTANRIARLNADGTLDTAFTTNTGTGSGSTVTAVDIQPDGKIVIGGSFTTWKGVTVYRIVRLNSDGTEDGGFTTNIGTGPNNNVAAISAQADGKVLVGGLFSTWNGAANGRIVRLNSDGTTDTAFSTNAGTGAASTVSVIATQSDSKIVVGGAFSTWKGVAVNRIVRLNADGTKNNFATIEGTSNGTVYATAVQSDGKVLVGGSFTSWGESVVNGIVRLNSDATRDTSFIANLGTGPNTLVSTIVEQPDGKILVGGGFTTWNGVTANRIIRLNADGTVDTAFSANMLTAPNGSIDSIALQSDGKIVVGGAFNYWGLTVVGYIARLNSDGTMDTAFSDNSGTGADANVLSVTIRPDGKILAAGNFGTWNSATSSKIVLLNSDGTRDTTFSTNVGTGGNSGVNAVGLQSDGKIVVGGAFTAWNGTASTYIVCLNADGTRNTAFTDNMLSGPSGFINAIQIQSDDKIVIGGASGFTYWSTTLVNRIARINPNGSIDSAFTVNAGTGANGEIRSLAIRPDGRIIVAGFLTSFNSILKNKIFQIGGDLAS